MAKFKNFLTEGVTSSLANREGGPRPGFKEKKHAIKQKPATIKLTDEVEVDEANETPGDIEMRNYHIDNLEVTIDPSSEVDDYEFTQDELDDLAAEIGDEFDDEIDDLVRESVEDLLESEQLDEISKERASAYLDKAKKNWDVARKDYEDPKKNAKANDTLGKRNTGIDLARKKLAKEDVDLEESNISQSEISKLAHKHVEAAHFHKSKGNLKGYAAHADHYNDIVDAALRKGQDESVPAKRILAKSEKIFAEHPHKVNESVEALDEISKERLKDYIDKTKVETAQMKKAGANKGGKEGRTQWELADIKRTNGVFKATDKIYHNQFTPAEVPATDGPGKPIKQRTLLQKAKQKLKSVARNVANTKLTDISKSVFESDESLNEVTVQKTSTGKFYLAHGDKVFSHAKQKWISKDEASDDWKDVAHVNQPTISGYMDRAKRMLRQDESVEDITEEVGVVGTIQKIASGNGKTIAFDNGQNSEISQTDAKLILAHINTLKDDLQDKYKKMLSKNAKSFMLALNLAVGN